MINRRNYQDVQEYLNYQENIRQIDAKSVQRLWAYLRHLIEWAGDQPLTNAKRIQPSFPSYLVSARNDGKDEPLAPITMKKTCETARMFFRWCIDEQPLRYKKVPLSWVDSIRPARSRGVQTEVKEHLYYSLDEMYKLAACPVDNLHEKRDRAAACFLYLSGMRINAFISLPIDCVDIKGLRVYQEPGRGVRTKNHKAAVTSLLNIPILLTIVKEWDDLIRGELAPGDNWYAPLDFSGNLVNRYAESEGRRELVVKGLKLLCKRAGIRYLSPHKYRHGHVVYGLLRAKDMKGLKAVSQNVMHSNIAITDGVYGQFLGDDVHNEITGFQVDTVNQGGGESMNFIQFLVELEKRGLTIQPKG